MPRQQARPASQGRENFQATARKLLLTEYFPLRNKARSWATILHMKILTDSEEQDATQWMHEAVKVAERALCLKARCGTVIVADGEIIGRGYNAPPLDNPAYRTCDKPKNAGGKPGYDQTCCLHAEWRAIHDAMRNHPEKLTGSKLYFTRIDTDGEIKKSGEPYYTVCSRMALDAGVTEFILWQERGMVFYLTDEYNALSYSYVHMPVPATI